MALQRLPGSRELPPEAPQAITQVGLPRTVPVESLLDAPSYFWQPRSLKMQVAQELPQVFLDPASILCA
eukprot:4570516-Alexandrium_andersonii.AAC.1